MRCPVTASSPTGSSLPSSNHIIPITPPLHGIIRVRDIRSHDIDSVVLYDMYHVNDIIGAPILSMSDMHHYYLTSALNEYGVICAYSSAHHLMMPVSWSTMQCPVTGEIQKRKVAKIGT